MFKQDIEILFIIVTFTFSSTVTIEDSPNKINVMDALTILQQTDEPGPPQEIEPIGKLYSLFKTFSFYNNCSS